MEYHVSKSGSDHNKGTADAPFLTIQKAADVMCAGDSVTVHEGIYREWVKPARGGAGDSQRITYEAAPGEKVEIRGSEEVKNWENVGGTVWKTEVSNTLFGGYNPYTTTIEGDWLLLPHNPAVHTGEVYLNGKALYEALSMEELVAGKIRTEGQVNPYSHREELIPDPEATKYLWHAEVNDETTVIYANFHEYDPNRELTEINVRRSCFFPVICGFNYITVRGFEMSQAACKYAPPTSFQTGLIGPYWSKGWIIENNRIHDAKCSAVCLGKEERTGDNECTEFGIKPGYQTQLEICFKALNVGWSFDLVGSHIVRNNVIYDCGQNGVVGNLGAIGSEIYGNEIYNIGMKYEFFGWEIGGVKLHAALDVKIHNNYIHNCLLGTWLDWEAQGVRVSSNIYDKNMRGLMVEVSHGPYLVDNNIITDELSFENMSQGGALVNNLFGGFTMRNACLDRATPYHYPHSTRPLGTAVVYGGDDRVMMNLFAGGREADKYAGNERFNYGTSHYNGKETSLEDYVAHVRSLGYADLQQHQQVGQPVYIRDNVYHGAAESFEKETGAVRDEQFSYEIVDDGKNVYLMIELSAEALEKTGEMVTSGSLPAPRISGERFENPDGTSLAVDRDLVGAERGARVHVGPIENLKPGRNKVLIWQRKND